MPILGWIPGMSAEDAAQREINAGQLKDDGTGIKEGKYNWQDRFGGFLGGYDQSDVEAAGQRIRDTGLQKKIDQKYGTIGDELRGLGLKSNYKGSVTGIAETELMKQIGGDTSKLKAALNYLEIDNADAGDLSPSATATGIVQAGTKLKAKNKTAAETKVQTEVERKEGRADDLLALQFANSAADRQADREYRRDQQAYQNRKLDMQEARLDRKDRQAAIQSMMAGLAQLGASIAI